MFTGVADNQRLQWDWKIQIQAHPVIIGWILSSSLGVGRRPPFLTTGVSPWGNMAAGFPRADAPTDRSKKKVGVGPFRTSPLTSQWLFLFFSYSVEESHEIQPIFKGRGTRHHILKAVSKNMWNVLKALQVTS